MKYQNIEIGDLTDKQLNEAAYDLNYLLAHRENRLWTLPNRLKKPDGSAKFDFDKINPAFVQLKLEIEQEIKVRKARS